MSNISIRKAQAFLSQAVEAHQGAMAALHQAKVRAIHSGWYFLQARQEVGHGEWQAFLAENQCSVPVRTVQAYMRFAEDALISVVAQKRELSDAEVRALELTPKEIADKALFEATQQIVIHSTQGFVALGRELELFRKFGTYDAVQHSIKQARKAGGMERQVEFDWTLATAGLQSIRALARATPATLPPREKLAEMEATLSEALATVRDQIATLSAVDASPADEASATTPPVEPTSRTTASPSAEA